jgi:hypothetical protein
MVLPFQIDRSGRLQRYGDHFLRFDYIRSSREALV